MDDELTLYGRSPEDGSLQAIVVEEENVQKIIRIELADRLKGRIRSWKKQGYVEDSKVFGALYGLEVSVNTRYEGLAKELLYPIAEQILAKQNFYK